MAAGLRHKRGRGGGWPDVICESCDARGQHTHNTPRHSIPGGLPFSPPPLFLSSRHYGDRKFRNDIHDITASLLTHSYIHTYASGTKYPLPLSSFLPRHLLWLVLHTHTNRNVNLCPTSLRLPCLPPDRTTGYAVLVLLRAANRYFAEAVREGYTIRGICALGREREPRTLSRAPPPSP